MKKILLIDDENSIARLVGSMAGDAGYAFAYAEDGAEGLVVAEREAPDLVIMDVMMPRMDGFTTCRLMRERGITCPSSSSPRRATSWTRAWASRPAATTTW